MPNTPLIWLALKFVRHANGDRDVTSILVPAFDSKGAEELLRAEGHAPADSDTEVYLTTDGHMARLRDANCPKTHSYSADTYWPRVTRIQHERWLQVATRPSVTDGEAFPPQYRRIA